MSDYDALVANNTTYFGESYNGNNFWHFFNKLQDLLVKKSPVSDYMKKMIVEFYDKTHVQLSVNGVCVGFKLFSYHFSIFIITVERVLLHRLGFSQILCNFIGMLVQGS